MKVCKVELYIVDFDGLGPDEIQQTLECQRFPNDCINVNVMDVKEVDIGEWRDDHPLNLHSSSKAEYERLFKADSV